MSNIDSVILQLNNISDSLAVDCPIVSAKSTVKFKPLSVTQQKQLIKNATGLALDTIKISNIINKIIIDNAENATQFNVIDKEGILLAMKLQSVQSGDEQQNMNKVLQQLQTLDAQSALTKTIEQHSIELQLLSPSLQRDSAINSEFIEQFKDKQLTNTDIISQYYVYDIIKYIHQFKLGKETVSFTETSNAKDYAAIVHHLPASLVGLVADFAADSKQMINKVFQEHNVPLQSAAF
jgi:hypothetical protein